MRALRVTAHLRGPVTGAPMLDGLLAFVVARRRGLVAGFGPLEHVEIPIEREPGGRFHLCSSPIADWEANERRFVQRRFPVHEAQMMSGPGLRRIRISAGACRSYRIPGDVAWAAGDAVGWALIGDAQGVRDLLTEVTHLGKRRGVGRGTVAAWSVEACESWGDGFPIVRDGQPTRPLPVEWPDLGPCAHAYSTLSYPYWEHTAEQLCAVPS